MCGQFTLLGDPDNAAIQRILNETNRLYPEQPVRTGDIFPTNTTPVLMPRGDRLGPVLATWGYPKYQGSGVIINARAETAAEKPTFREGVLHRRCVVPSTGFYEWNAEKRKYWFTLPGKKMLYMAGICREYAGQLRYVILTTAANPSMADVHHRMPVILPQNKLMMWAFDTNAALQYLSGVMPVLERRG